MIMGKFYIDFKVLESQEIMFAGN